MIPVSYTHLDLNYFVYENFNIEWTILSFRTHVSDTIEEMAAEGIEETADTAEAPEENVSDSGTAGETEDSVPADDASVTTVSDTQLDVDKRQDRSYPKLHYLYWKKNIPERALQRRSKMCVQRWQRKVQMSTFLRAFAI